MRKYVLRREELPFSEITDKEIESKLKRDLQRRVNFLERRRIMDDNMKPTIENLLQLMFSAESFSDMRQYIDVSNNLARRVLKEISVVYKDEPSRTVSPQASQKIYQRLTGMDEGFDLNSKMSRANFLLNGMNDLILQAALMGEELDVHVYTPDMVTVFENPDNPTELDALMIEDYYLTYDYLSNDAIYNKQWIFWSPTRHFIIDKDFRKRSVIGNEEMINPFRDINIATGQFYPFLFVHNSPREGKFWDQYTGTDLMEGTKLLAIQNTFRHFMVPMQFKQIAVQVNTVDDGKSSIRSNQIKSPLHVFTSNGTISTLDWQSNLQQLNETIQSMMFGIAGNYGISQENFKLQSSGTSGFARTVAKERLTELRADQWKVWRAVETQIYRLLAAFTDLYGLEGPSPTGKFSIDFAESKEIEDPQVELDVIKQKLEMGMLNLYDVVRKENPDIETDEEADAFIRKNIEIRNSLKSRFSVDLSALNQGGPDGQGTAAGKQQPANAGQ